MYSVVIFEENLEVKSIPIKFIKNFDPIRTANDAVNQSNTHVVFYSQNHDEQPKFNLGLRSEFNDTIQGCYKARILKFFEEKDAAENYAKARRKILPMSYRDKEQNNDGNGNESDEDNENTETTIPENKLAVRNEIQQKILAMDGQCIDLDDSDVEDFQELFYEDEETDEDIFEWAYNCDVPAPITFKIEPTLFEDPAERETDINVEESDEFQKNLPADLPHIADELDSNGVDAFDNNENNCDGQNVVGNFDGISRASFIGDFGGEKALSSSKNVHTTENSTFKLSGTIDSNIKPVPELIAMNRPKVQSKPIDMDELKYTMGILHMHFPEEYPYTFDAETKMFRFILDISLKYSIVKTIIGWNVQPTFNNILYDEKFVALLLNFVIGKENLRLNNLPKDRIRFIRATFALRVGTDNRRAIRFGEYVHGKVSREMDKVKLRN